MFYTIHLIVGARPNQMKAGPLLKAMKDHPKFHPILVDTGQHYDHEMAGIFLEQFEMGQPDFALDVGSGTHGKQTAMILERYEALLLDHRPDACIVIGDINSTVACTLAAVKLGIPLVHLEAGLRSHDRTMPEEINRIITDSVADLLWTPSPDGDEHLLAAGVDSSKIVRVGNIMIDTLVSMKSKFEQSTLHESLALQHQDMAVVTLHRPSNVDDETTLNELLNVLISTSKSMDIVWPVHPRTKARIHAINRFHEIDEQLGIHLLPPLGYIDFMGLVNRSRCVITDSGGIQEETTWLGIPCLTLRPNTERPITITEGTNKLTTPPLLSTDVEEILNQSPRRDIKIDLWDGCTAKRCLESLEAFLEGV